MAKTPPSFDLYPGDIVKSTTCLTAAQFGAYFRLLMFQWEHGHIPQTEHGRMLTCGVLDKDEWGQIWEAIEGRFEVLETEETSGLSKNDVLMAQPRMHEQRKRSIEVWEARRNGGRKGGRPLKTRENETQQPSIPRGSSEKTSTEGGRGKNKTIKKEVSTISFDDFWSIVPSACRSRKSDAAGYWKKMSHQDRQDALRAFPKYASSPLGREYPQSAAAWLYQRRWEDDPESWNRNRSEQIEREKIDRSRVKSKLESRRLQFFAEGAKRGLSEARISEIWEARLKQEHGETK